MEQTPQPEVTVDQMVADPGVLAAVALRHGMHPSPRPEELFADVQHLVSPIVGHMRLDGEFGHRLERLSLVLALAERAQRADHDAGGVAVQARRLREWQDRVLEQLGQVLTAERFARAQAAPPNATDLADVLDALLADRQELDRLRTVAAHLHHG